MSAMEEAFEKLGEKMCQNLDTMPVRRDLLKLHEFQDGTGRGLCAKEDIPRGQFLVQVPVEYTINADNARKVLGAHVVPNDMREDDVIAVYLMWARCNREKISEIHRIHLDLLPEVEKGPSALHQTMFWTDEELEHLRGSEAYATAIHLKQQVREDFGDIVNKVFLPHPDMFPLGSSNFTYREYKWALAIIWSRGMDFLGATEKGNLHCIVPWADMFNTKSSVRQCHFYSQKNACIGVIATEPIKQGDQAFINYGKVDNARMLRLYGFILPENPHNHVSLWVTFDPNNSNFAAAMARVKAVNPEGFDPNRSPFTLSLEQPLPKNLLDTLRIHHELSSTSPTDDGHLVTLQAALVGMLNQYPSTGASEGEGAPDALTLAMRELSLLEGGTEAAAAVARDERKRLALQLKIAECKILNASLAAVKSLLNDSGVEVATPKPEVVDPEEVGELDCMD